MTELVSSIPPYFYKQLKEGILAIHSFFIVFSFFPIYIYNWDLNSGLCTC
jgi:hypothetical protein